VLEASPAAQGHSIECIRSDDEAFYLPLAEDGTAEVTLRWAGAQCIRRVVLREQLRMSQRVESYALDAWQEGAWAEVASGTVVGRQRIIPLEGICTDRLRIRITDARIAPTLRFVGVYA